MKNLLLSVLSLLIVSFSAANDNFEIKLKSGNFTPDVTTDFENALRPLHAEKSRTSLYRLVQFYSIPTTKEKQAVQKAGITLINYIPNKAFLCRIDKTASVSSFQELRIRSIIPIENRFKLAKELTQEKLPKWALNGDDIRLKVKHFLPNDQFELINFIEENDGVVLENLETINTLHVQYSAAEINNLAENPLVQWIEPVSPSHTPDDTGGRTSSRSNVLNSKYVGGRKYDGTGLVVALGDQGNVGPHIDFEGRLTNHIATKSGNHGDMTSGIFVGAGNLDPTVEGMVPGAEINIYKVEPFLSLGVRAYPHVFNAVDNLSTLGTIVTSTSYSQGEGGVYTSDCEFVDEQIDGEQKLMHVFSAGNSGTRDHGYGAGVGWGNISGGTKAAKNVICVGNVTAADEIFITSGRGPAADGRIKPDICAKGEGHRSTDENNSYQNGSGTSASTPLIAGVITQLYHAYKENNGGNEPESALLKASVLNTANDIGNPGPDFTTGWGSVNALKAVRIIEDDRYIRGSIGQGENANHKISVPDNVAQVRIMTYWSDVKGSAAAAKALVNDINMQVADPAGTDYDPWVLDPTPNATNLDAPATRGIDNLNNMEQVTIDNPSAGDYTVNLYGFAIPEGPQTYYVVYDFIYDDIELVYPVGGEGLASGELENIMWDASESSENFALEYSTDGGDSYTMISSSISSTSRSYPWFIPPVVSGNAKIRLIRGASQSESRSAFTLAPVPQNFTVASVCPDSIELTWNAVNSASMYEISMLGDKYMDSIGVSNTNSFKIGGLNINDGHWFSVRSIVDGSKGRRAIAIYQTPGTQNCILNTDVGIAELVYPPSGVISNCKDLGNTEVLIRIDNFGMSDATDFELNYQVNGGAVVTESFSGAIGAGENTIYAFSQKPDLSIAGTYNIRVWCIFNSDENIFNDTLNTEVKVLNGTSISALPHSENFQSFSACSTSPTCEAVNCQLTGGWINFENLINDDIDWRTDAGGTTTSNTGPSADFDLGTAAGQYLYIEGTEGCNYKEAILLSPCIDLTDESCAQLTFAYHMFGVNIGELHVDFLTKNGIIEDVVLPVIGSQGDQWNLMTIDLSPYAGDIVNARVRGSIGGGSRADIAIDAFNVESFPVPVADFTFSETGTSVSFTANSGAGINEYFWDFGDGNTSTDMNPVHEYTSGGSFDVTLIVEGNCGRDTITQTIGLTNTQILKAVSKIEIHPNPTSGNITIKLPIQLPKHKVSVKLIDVLGATVINFESEKNQNILPIDISEITDGVYFVEISGEQFRTIKKIVKQ